MPPFVKVIIITPYADKLMRQGLREAQVGDVCQDLYGLFCSIALARVREKLRLVTCENDVRFP